MLTAVVTGANRGLGLGFVRQLLARTSCQPPNLGTAGPGRTGPDAQHDKYVYSKVIATARSFDPHGDSELAALVRESNGRVGVVGLAEVGDVDSCVDCADQIRSLAPNGVQLLINNAGYANQPKPMTPLRLPTIAGAIDYHRTFTVNAYGPLLLSSALLDIGLLRSRSSPSSSFATLQPPPRPPTIVNISSGQASLSRAAELFDSGSARDELFFHPVYAASKVALSGVTLHLARILRDQVIVGQIHPGWIKTTMGRTYAHLTVDQSAAKVLDVVDSWTTLKHSGRYVDEENRTIGW